MEVGARRIFYGFKNNWKETKLLKKSKEKKRKIEFYGIQLRQDTLSKIQQEKTHQIVHTLIII